MLEGVCSLNVAGAGRPDVCSLAVQIWRCLPFFPFPLPLPGCAERAAWGLRGQSNLRWPDGGSRLWHREQLWMRLLGQGPAAVQRPEFQFEQYSVPAGGWELLLWLVMARVPLPLAC